jgi:hypothetical protein
MSAAGYDLKFAAEAIWKVGVASLVLGAGVPIVFAAGIRALAWGSADGLELPGAKPNPLGRILGGLIFLIVAYAIAAGIVYVIATGKGANYDITFKHVIPEIYKKAS